MHLEKTLAKPWLTGPNVDLKTAFAPIKKLMLEDPVVRVQLASVEALIKKRGYSEIVEIIEVCDEEEDQGGEGFFKQEMDIAGTRIHLPGKEPDPWSEEEAQAIKESFSSQVIELPFLDYLVTMKAPKVCLAKDLNLGDAYTVLVHELVHFSSMDVFDQIKRTLNLRAYSDYATSTIRREGGELDAFKMGIGAEVRLLAKIGVANPAAEHPYASPDGTIHDVAALEQTLIEPYQAYYADPTIKIALLKDVYGNYQARVEILGEYVMPFLLAHNDKAMLKSLRTEIASLKIKIAELAKEYPKILN